MNDHNTVCGDSSGLASMDLVSLMLYHAVRILSFFSLEVCFDLERSTASMKVLHSFHLRVRRVRALTWSVENMAVRFLNSVNFHDSAGSW